MQRLLGSLVSSKATAFDYRVRIDTLHPTAILNGCKPGKRAPLVLRFLAETGKLIPGTPVMSVDFMRRAIALALENVRSGRGGPFGAVVAKDGRIIAQGANCVTATNDPTAHAEIVAIREACRALKTFQLDGCELYTICEPCPMCLGAIYWARPARVFYAGLAADAAAAGFDDAFIYEELKVAPGKRRIPMLQCMREESLAVFSAWKQQPNKTPY